MNPILYFIALIPLKTLLLPSGSHIVSCFSARAEIPFRLLHVTWDFFRFSARVELRPGLNPSPCNRQFDFKSIFFRSQDEILAQAEIRHVIRPLDGHDLMTVGHCLRDHVIETNNNFASVTQSLK